jgi:hypothetical protein
MLLPGLETSSVVIYKATCQLVAIIICKGLSYYKSNQKLFWQFFQFKTYPRR